MPSRIKGSHITTRSRLKPPATLSPEASKLFAQTVAAVDPGHFSEVDIPLLEQYAAAADLARQAQRNLDEHGAVIGGKLSSWVTVLEKASRSCVALSARLRICPQSRYDRLVAGANSRVQHRLSDFEDDDGLLARSPEEEDFFAQFAPSPRRKPRRTGAV